ncbi:MAG: M20/M25/M40 family metallo-hydrolase [Bryobacteraceae bacterium]|nr:M20/M25/M40 family metallo-hydrolase [Bryobacteraceae bacterium]
MRARYLLLTCGLVAASVFAQDQPDLAVIHRIKAEAFQNSKVMDHLFYLTDVHGPRVTNSKGYRSAVEWVQGRLKEIGLTNVRTESFGPWGKSWDYTRFEGHMVEPGYMPLIGFPLAWTPGTDGAVEGEPVLAVMTREEDLEKFKGKLRGKIVLITAPKVLAMSMQPQARRWSEAELTRLSEVPDVSRMGNFSSAPQPGSGIFGSQPPAPAAPQPDRQRQAAFRNKRNQFLKDEGALLVLDFGSSGDGGTLFASGGGSREKKDPVPPPMAAITPEHYNRIARLLDKKIPVKLRFDIRTEMGDSDEPSVNVLGEIEGGGKKDEVVMLGGHFDSWQGGTGATDNATGSSVAIEAMRILKSLNVKMNRTVRIALWGGEEQGLLGSIAYVRDHFADRKDMQLKPEYSKLVAYFNSDNGTGKFRGIRLGGNGAVKPVFEAWAKPLADLGFGTIVGATTSALQRPGGSDHTSFEFVGLNGFAFLQDPTEYQSRTHHSNMDVYDRVQPGDVMQSAAVMAAFVYHVAMRPEQLPRKPLPKAHPDWDKPRSNVAASGSAQ